PHRAAPASAGREERLSGRGRPVGGQVPAGRCGGDHDPEQREPNLTRPRPVPGRESPPSGGRVSFGGRGRVIMAFDRDDMDLFHDWVELAEAEGPESAEALAFIGEHAEREGFVEMVRGWKAGERIMPGFQDYAEENR